MDTPAFNYEGQEAFVDVSHQIERNYHFPGGDIITILGPIKLGVYEGWQRIFDFTGRCHMIPPGWIKVDWVVEDGKPHFVE